MLTLTPGQVVPYVQGRKIAHGTVLAEQPKEVRKMFDRPGKRPNHPYRLWELQPHQKRRPCDPDIVKIREEAIQRAMEIQEAGR
jgi:hypothetical protein